MSLVLAGKLPSTGPVLEVYKTLKMQTASMDNMVVASSFL